MQLVIGSKHNALLDCELLRKVYINLIGEKEPTLVFQDASNPNNFSDKNKIKNTEYSKIIVKASPEEISNHADFLKSNLKKNYF